MGYTTTFKGQLNFTTELNGKQLKKLKSYLGEDCRQHPEWGENDFTYIDLELTEDFTGIQWDGSEKTYDLEGKVNLVIHEMQKEYPDFGLEGYLTAQGERFDDRWTVAIVDGRAVKQTILLKGQKVTCPHCHEDFILEDKKN